MKNNFENDTKKSEWLENVKYYEKLKSTILEKIELKLGKKEGSIWFSDETDLYGIRLKEKYPEYSDRKKYVAWHILYGSSFDETTINDICFYDFKEEDCSVKNFFKKISEKIDSIS